MNKMWCCMNTNAMNNILKFSLYILYFGAGDVKLNVHTGTVASSVQFTIHQHRCQERVLGIKRPEKHDKDNKLYIIEHECICTWWLSKSMENSLYFWPLINCTLLHTNNLEVFWPWSSNQTYTNCTVRIHIYLRPLSDVRLQFVHFPSVNLVLR